MKIRVIIVLLVAMLAGRASYRSTPASPTTVLIVRHAEKGVGGDDPPLTEAGARRAQALVGVVSDSGVDAIYSSQFARSRDTVGPVAQRARVPVTQMDVNLESPGDYGQRLARTILDRHVGRRVLVVSHLNTIPALVEGLTGRPMAPLKDVEYANLFVVIVGPDGAAHLIRAQYGQADDITAGA